MITKEEFYNHYIERWMKDEVSVMKDRNLNFPLSLCILSYMDFLGSILYGKNRFGFINAELYIEKCFNNKAAYPFEILNNFIRIGLTHEYFPRGGISRHALGTAMYMDEKDQVVLDAAILAEDFLNSLENFKKLLYEDRENFEKRLNEREEELQKLKTKYQQQLSVIPRLVMTGADSSAIARPESSAISGLAHQNVSQIAAGIKLKQSTYVPPSISALDNDVLLKQKDKINEN